MALIDDVHAGKWDYWGDMMKYGDILTRDEWRLGLAMLTDEQRKKAWEMWGAEKWFHQLTFELAFTAKR